MVNPFIWLLLLSVTMLIGSFLFGCIPLASKLSEHKLKQLTAIGVGLLIGTSLVVIIPEGVETLYSSSSSSLETSSITHINSVGNPTSPIQAIPSWHNGPVVASTDDYHNNLSKQQDNIITHQIEGGREKGGVEEEEEEGHDHDENESSTHTAVGLSLIFGYAVMFIIDQYSSLHVHGSSTNNNSKNPTINKYRTSLSEGTDQDHELDNMLTSNRNENMELTSDYGIEHVHLTNKTTNPLISSSSPNDNQDVNNINNDNGIHNEINENSNNGSSNNDNNRMYHSSTTTTTNATTISSLPHKSHSMTPTIGLIVHAAADGIALGASATHPKLSMVVFFAIMLHKGPSAFALTTVLLAEGFSRLEVRKHLLLFSLAAPTGALTTYIFLAMTTSPDDHFSLEYWTGILLLFSGGTFLYVAMHALQELQQQSSSSSSSYHHHHHHDEKLDRSSVICILIGMILPMILNLGHSH